MPFQQAERRTRILKFERADWTSFRTVEGLQQKAGVAADKLRRLVLKELTDNALDTGASVSVGRLPSGGYFIEDDGRGIDGTPEEIARLFSIARPMVSTKLLRLPTRGALGNGLRVVAGSVLASNGSLVVTTRGKRIELRPERDGSTTVVSVKPVKFPVGTRIEISFGPAIPEDANALHWARIATEMAQAVSPTPASRRRGGTTPRNFTNCCRRAANAPVRELVANLDGCTGARAGEIVAEAGLGRMACADISREQADTLLTVARKYARAVDAEAAWCCRSRSVSRPRLRHVERRSVVRHWTAARRDSVRRRGLGRRERDDDGRHHRLRQPHAGHWRHRCGARQAGHRPVRMRA